MTQEVLQTVQDGSSQVQEMVDTILADHCKTMDTFMDTVRNLFFSDNIPDGELDRVILEIPVHIYYLTQILQEIDIRKGVSAENAKYYENEALLGATGTVAEKQAKATNASIKNRIVQLAYKNATATIQAKVNGAMEILNSAKAVQKRRLKEMELTRNAGSSVGAF